MSIASNPHRQYRIGDINVVLKCQDNWYPLINNKNQGVPMSYTDRDDYVNFLLFL